MEQESAIPPAYPTLRFGGDSADGAQAHWFYQPPRGGPIWLVFNRLTGEVVCKCARCRVGHPCEQSAAAPFATAVEDAARALHARCLPPEELAALAPATPAEAEAVRHELARRASLGPLAPLRHTSDPATRRMLRRQLDDDLFGAA